MAIDKPYLDIPGTTVFDGDKVRKGFHLNQFCMSLMKETNRQTFKINERSYLDNWSITEEQKQAVIDRDYSKLIELGGNIYYLLKIGATDGLAVATVVSTMTDISTEEYMAMMKKGGRSPEGIRYINEKNSGDKK